MTASKQPTGKGWTFCGFRMLPPPCYKALLWQSDDGLSVLSAVEDPEGPEEFHLSAVCFINATKQRVCTDEEMERVRADFGMGGAEEDNHGPGNARHLWLRTDKDTQEECPCKQDEERVVEGSRVRYEKAEEPTDG